MTPNPTSREQEGEETALSSPSHGTIAESLGLTEGGGPTDVTVVRGTPSAPTVIEKTLLPAPPANNFGKYELLGEIARGGMGVVHRARQQGLDRLVALKMILGTGEGEETTERFLLEARAAAALDHPNVVPIYDIGEIDGRRYFTMALIDGPNLRGYIEKHGTLSIPAVVALFAQIVMGVAHAHKHGFVHRDLKPANVLIDADSRPRITDFGLAKRSTTDSHLTTTGQVVGTPAYMAPEQARDSKDVGPPADVYALGAILYFMLTGQPPLQGEGLTDLLIKVVSEQPVPPRQHRSDVPVDLEAVCLKCLAKSPLDRFPDAEALAISLAPIADQYLTPSANLTPSVANIGTPRPRTMPSVGTAPDVAGLTPSISVASVSTVGLPQPPNNRKPLIIGLSVLAVVLIAVIGALVMRSKKPDTVKQDPPNISGELDTFAWPAPTRADFGLKVDLIAPAAIKGADGIIRMTEGSSMTVHLKADRDCHVSMWLLEPNGQAMRLFPNDDEKDDQLKAGVERVLPGRDTYKFETTATQGEGSDRLRVIATTNAQPKFPDGVKNGQFTVYAGDNERKTLVSTVRGVIIKKTGKNEPASAAVSEAEIRFRVQK